MEIKKYKCFDCSKANNFTDDMRCSACGALHNSEGKEQKLKIKVTFLTNDTVIDDVTELNEKELRMVVGLSSVNDEIWIKTLELKTYTVGTVKYDWERI